MLFNDFFFFFFIEWKKTSIKHVLFYFNVISQPSRNFIKLYVMSSHHNYYLSHLLGNDFFMVLNKLLFDYL